MKNKSKRIIAGVMAVLLCFGMTGCGRESFDVTENIDVSFEGYDGYGTCSLENEYKWIDDVIDWYGDSINDSQKIKSELELMDTVTYDIDKKKNLSNGDTITISAKIDDDAEEYAFDLTGKELTVTVEGLEEIEKFDPFENISIIYDGLAPYATAKINYEKNDSSVTYEIDKNTGLSNGDTVTVTAYADCNMNEYAQRYGKVFSETQKTFTVEGVASYAMSIEEIPQDMINKMRQQANDGILANAAKWREEVSLSSSDFLGYYFLISKEGYSQNPFNDLYFVYKNTTSATGLKRGGNGETKETGTEEYYTYYHFTDIILMPDGTCSVDLSNGEFSSNSIESDYGYRDLFDVFYQYNGYQDLDSMFNDCVAAKIETYNYESTVQ